MMKRSTTIRSMLAALLAVAVVLAASHANADEPQEVTVALLFDTDTALDILAEGKVIVFGAGPRPEGSTQKSLDDYFPVYGGANINRKHALTVTKGKIYSNVVFSIGDLGAPANGSLVLNNDVTIDYMGIVSESSNTIGEDESGDRLLIILTGPVR